MSYSFEDLEQELGKRASRVSVDQIMRAAERLGGSGKVYVSNSVKKEIAARIPLTKHPKVELCVFIEEPFTRMTIFFESQYTEIDRQNLNLPSIFASLWLEDSEGKRHFGKSLIPHSVGYLRVELSDLASSQPDVYEEARNLAGQLIALL